MILLGDDAVSIAHGAEVIRAGRLLGLPTETVYGLAADADNDAAVAQIFVAKGRPADHPLIVHVVSAEAANHYAASVPDFAQRLMASFWPGPLTLILPRRSGVATAAAGGNATIGLRCPAHPVAQALLKALNWGQSSINFQVNSEKSKKLESDPNLVWGLAAPSANLFGRVSPTTAQHVQDEFGDDLLVLDGGPCSVGIESTIVDCTRGAPVVLRPGAITSAAIEATCGLKALSKEDQSGDLAQAPKASGTLESHYAPRARVRLMSTQELQTALKLMRTDTHQTSAVPRIAIYARSVLAIKTPHVLYRRMPADAAATAQELFASFRAFDAQGIQLIWVEVLPEEPEWDGVRDRLQRAAS